MGSARGVGSWRSWVQFAVIVCVGTGRTAGVTIEVPISIPMWVPI
jgi:hypothetical protein